MSTADGSPPSRGRGFSFTPLARRQPHWTAFRDFFSILGFWAMRLQDSENNSPGVFRQFSGRFAELIFFIWIYFQENKSAGKMKIIRRVVAPA